VLLGNAYFAGFLFPGYTRNLSRLNKDDPNVHYDDNGFLVRLRRLAT